MIPYLQRKGAKGHTHRYFVDSETSDAVCLCGKVRGSKKAEPGKYHAIRCEYGGYWYDSKFEAQTAMQLDWRKQSGDIKAWERQFFIEIRHNGELIRRHKVDFRIEHHDGSFELVEVKGVETQEYRLLKKLIEIIWLPEHPDHSYTVVK